MEKKITKTQIEKIIELNGAFHAKSQNRGFFNGSITYSFKHLAVRGVCKTAGFSLFFDPRVLIFVIFEVIFTKLSQFVTDPENLNHLAM